MAIDVLRCQVNTDAANRLASDIIYKVLEGKSRPEAEMALVIAYIRCANGTLEYPKSTRAERMVAFAMRASEQLAGLVAQVGALSDEEARAAARAAAV